VAHLSRTLARLERILGGGEVDLALTVENLRQITDNLRDLTEDTKRYPAHVLFGEPPRPLEGRR
jgi:ABC-type transporter Mla subunit MlaD